ncbi:hypothetical protein PVAP13_8KG202505 [Panicum virgatum]|uniref:Uncharacterized protein n=1 Tax=Panicum virgatum TaxID=38727 RepID=A0A8T0PN95_PANVG|nr:hypothetical protein PVAP13_8KG202505 [Panicum virgatum]
MYAGAKPPVPSQIRRPHRATPRFLAPKAPPPKVFILGEISPIYPIYCFYRWVPIKKRIGQKISRKFGSRPGTAPIRPDVPYTPPPNPKIAPKFSIAPSASPVAAARSLQRKWRAAACIYPAPAPAWLGLHSPSRLHLVRLLPPSALAPAAAQAARLLAAALGGTRRPSP